MSSTGNSKNTMATSRTERVRQASAARRQAERARARRRRTLAVTGVVVAVLAAVVAIGIGVQSTRNSTDSQAAVPAGVEDYAIAVGSPTAPVTIAVYEDFLCPACAGAEAALGPTLQQLADDGRARLEYRMMSFLDRASSDRYSTRALNAAACVVDSAPQAFPAFHASLFAEQPTEGGAGLSDARLGQLAEQAGAPGVQDCIEDLRFEDWTRQSTEAASRDGVNQTPTILVDGQPLTERTPEALVAAVQAAS